MQMNQEDIASISYLAEPSAPPAIGVQKFKQHHEDELQEENRGAHAQVHAFAKTLLRLPRVSAASLYDLLCSCPRDCLLLTVVP